MGKSVATAILVSGMVGCAMASEAPGLAGGPNGSAIQAIINPQRSATNYTEAILIQVNNPAADFCSGVLVAPQVVLTAAHCIIFNTQPGHTWTITAPFAIGGAQVRTATTGEPMDAASYSLTYANYDSHPELHDLGLIYLPTPFTNVGYPDLSATRYPVSGTPQVSAVGRSSVSAAAGLVLSPITTLSGSDANYPFDNHTPRITTAGDSGGPLFLEGTHTLVGTETRFTALSGPGQMDYWARLDDNAGSNVYTFISNRVASHGGWYDAVAGFRDDVASALCARVASCCAVSTPGYVVSSSKCDAIYDQFGFEATARGIQTASPANVSVDAVIKGACITKITNEAADCSITSAEVKAAITDCVSAVTGKLATGAACTSSLECAGSAVCEQSAAGAGTCQPLHASGASCEVLYKTGTSTGKRDNLAQDLCSKRGGGQTGLYCDTYDFVAQAYRAENTWTCKTTVVNGGSCNTDSYCSSFVCGPLGTAGANTCVASASFVTPSVCTAFAGP